MNDQTGSKSTSTDSLVAARFLKVLPSHSEVSELTPWAYVEMTDGLRCSRTS